MKVVILAGGKGTRLKPYTISIPKPLVPVADKAILEIVIQRFVKYGFRDFILSVNHMHELIRSYFGNGDKFGARIKYALEDKPLGTAGPIALLENTGEDFFVINGDILTDLDFSKLAEFHLKGGQDATIVSSARKVKIDLGVLNIGKTGALKDYIEKPFLRYMVSTGIYVFNNRVKKYIKKNKHMDLPELIRALIRSGKRIEIYNLKGLWLDIGTPADYEKATEYYKKNRRLFD